MNITFRSLPLIGLSLTLGSVLIGGNPDAPRVVEFAAPTTPAVAPLDLAQGYAQAQGLTSCDAPADAELDDTFLAMGVDEMGMPAGAILEIDLDTALDSKGKRHVLLACDAR